VALESPEDYCREIEAYLCRKNDGHLVRIVGPAFEHVMAWAAKGVPFTIACAGIDRYFERYYAKGPRRRPVRIEFCEADVLDAFDEWRRAVGVPASPSEETASSGGSESTDEPHRRRASLPAHLERVIARLTTLRGGADRSLDDVLDGIVRELDARRADAKALRGDARQELMDRLRALDATLLDEVRARCGDAELSRLEADAATELAAFRDRMPAAVFEQSRRAAVDRLLRERRRLPTLAFD